MDADRFDAFTKAWARGTSRRTLLKGLLGGVAGGVTGTALHEQASAVICRQGGVLCATDAQCCSGSCVNYHCTCEADQLPCGPRCCAPSHVCTDPAHGDCCTPITTCPTGVCGTISNGCGGTLECGCQSGELCTSGQCVTTTTTAPPTTTTTAPPTTTTTTPAPTTTTTTSTTTSTTTTSTTTAAPCLTAGTCCPDPNTPCQAQCCSGAVEQGALVCGGATAFACSPSPCGGSCGSANDCADPSATCVGRTCTCLSGTCQFGVCM